MSTQPYVSTNDVASSVPFDNSTDSYVATDVQAAIEETNKHLIAAEVSDTANATTTSGTDAVLTGMTVTPGAGTFLVWFSSSITSNNAGASISYSYYVNGVQKSDSVRKISPFDGGTLSATTARGDTSLNGLITVTAGQAIDVRWSTSGGTATAGPRTLNYLRIL